MTDGGPDLGPLPLPTWNAPGYGRPRNGIGIAALVVGVLALLSSITVLFGFLLGAVALTLGVIGRVRAARGQATNGGVALAGGILGALSIVVAILLVTAVFKVSETQRELYEECRQRATSDTERAACTEEFEGES